MKKKAVNFKAKPSNLVNTYVDNYSNSKHATKKHGILKWLLKNRNIITLQPDKTKVQL